MFALVNFVSFLRNARACRSKRRSFSVIYNRAQVGSRELRIMADLASSISQLTTDAVFTLIVQIQLGELNAPANKKRSVRVSKRRASKVAA